MTLVEAAQALRTGALSSEELVRESLSAIERRDTLLNAFITVTAESALGQARETDRLRAQGSPCGPLCGIPVALKDVFRTRGVRTTCGSRIFADYVPDYDCAVAERLAAAGAILIGKTGLHEFAYGVTSNNPHFGAIRNPWNPATIPGGSSGGSGAAVAAGMVFAAMGSDTGGSIRIPASYCGVVGLKPTSGRVSRYGVMPLDFSLDHMGPLTRSVRDAALILNVIAGCDERDDSSSRHPVEDYSPPPEFALRGIRIGLPENFFFERIEPEVKSAVESAAREAQRRGAEIVPVRLPDIAAINVVGRVILMCEASALLEPYLDADSGRRGDFGEDVRLLLDQGCLLPATDYVNAQRLRRKMQREFAAVWSEVDCLFTPATPITAPPIGAPTVGISGIEEDTRIASTRLARSINVLGLPALSMPCGFSSSGMPVGLQIVAPPFAEAGLLRIAAAIEDALALGERIAPQPGFGV
jgi:aspartyl-tRNA(Asn)/glutamyl-tRNA(Gln) amidotransferase subunit A